MTTTTNNRLTSRTYPNAAENVSFTYTSTGRRETATDARGTTSYGYDLRDRLTSLTQPGFGAGTASLGYTYDGNGNRLTLTATVAGQSHATSYTYDDASRLDVVTDPAGPDLRPRLRRERQPDEPRPAERLSARPIPTTT